MPMIQSELLSKHFKILCFGDSNAAGAELDPGQHPFVHWVAKELNCPYTNYARSGSSLGLILHTLVANLHEINKKDLVLIVIPPDTRWYDENEEQGFYSLQNYMRDDYFKFLNNKSLEWFRYHHALFIYTVQKILEDAGCNYIMTLAYGSIEEIQVYDLKIKMDQFLSKLDLLNLLAAIPTQVKLYDFDSPAEHRYDNDYPNNRAIIHKNPYFYNGRGEKINHPNEAGHKRLAELILKKYRDLTKID